MSNDKFQKIGSQFLLKLYQQRDFFEILDKFLPSLMDDVLKYKEKLVLLKISKGDEYAFRQLFETYSDRLGILIFNIVHSREIAEEAVQDIFLRLWLKRESLSEIDNFNTYIFVVSRNYALNLLRAQIREKNRLPTELHVIELVNGDENSDYERKESRLTLIDQAVSRLSPQQKQAWTLSRQQKLKHREIAEIMQISTSTVKQHIQRAIEAIRKHVLENLDLLIITLFFFFENKLQVRCF